MIIILSLMILLLMLLFTKLLLWFRKRRRSINNKRSFCCCWCRHGGEVVFDNGSELLSLVESRIVSNSSFLFTTMISCKLSSCCHHCYGCHRLLLPYGISVSPHGWWMVVLAIASHCCFCRCSDTWCCCRYGYCGQRSELFTGVKVYWVAAHHPSWWWCSLLT